MRHLDNLRSRIRLWPGKGVELCCSALCGVFVSLGMLSLTEWTPGAGFVLRAVMVAAFALTSVCGIYGRPRLMPKAAFALSQMITAFLIPPQLVAALALLLYLPLAALLIVGARWRGARFALLPLTFMLAFTMPPFWTPPCRGEKIPESLYLPALLTMEEPGGVVLVFGDSFSAELLDEIALTCRDKWLLIDRPRPLMGLLSQSDEKKFDIAVIGDSWRVCGTAARQGAYRWVLRRLKPGGVLVMPTTETSLLPPWNWKFTAMPGGDGRWVAARCGKAVRFYDPEHPDMLDDRIQNFVLSRVRRDIERGVAAPVARQSNPPILPMGAFEAMYPPTDVKCEVVHPPRRAGAARWTVFAAVAAAWMLLRLVLCRRAHMGTAGTAAETAAAMVIYSLAMLPKWSLHVLDTGIMPTALLAGLGLLLLPRPFPAVRRKRRILLWAAVGVLPWVPGLGSCWLPAVCWFCWFFSGAAVFTGLRSENRRAAFAGAVVGAAAGALFVWAAGGVESPLLACAAFLLMIPSWLRR